MTASDPNSDGLLLAGLDGCNPLAFLAALGTLRTLTLAWPDRQVRMSWRQHSGAWRPVLHIPSAPPVEAILDRLHACLCFIDVSHSARRLWERSRQSHAIVRRAEHRWRERRLAKEVRNARTEALRRAAQARREVWLEQVRPHLRMGDNTNLPAKEFARHLREARHGGQARRTLLDDLAALGTNIPDDKGHITDTALRTMSGSGNQHLLLFMGNLLHEVQKAHLRKALLRPWIYDDPVKNLTLRIDPADDVRYALRWRNPSGDPRREEAGSVLGANALAVAGFALFPVVPRIGGADTVGFSGRRASDTYWSWPIWAYEASMDLCRSLLALPELQADRPNRRKLAEIGIVEVYRSQRITIGKFRNFTPAQAV